MATEVFWGGRGCFYHGNQKAKGQQVTKKKQGLKQLSDQAPSGLRPPSPSNPSLGSWGPRLEQVSFRVTFQIHTLILSKTRNLDLSENQLKG